MIHDTNKVFIHYLIKREDNVSYDDYFLGLVDEINKSKNFYISDEIIKNTKPLQYLTEIESISISACKVHDISWINKLTNLRSIDLTFAYGLHTIEPLNNLTNLKQIRIAYCHPNMQQIVNELLYNNKTIESLILRSNDLVNLNIVKTINSLQQLYINKIKITDLAYLKSKGIKITYTDLIIDDKDLWDIYKLDNV